MELDMTDNSSVIDNSLHSASLLELSDLKKVLEEQISAAQQKMKLVKSELEGRYLERAQNKLRQDGKDFGAVTVEDNGFKIKVNIRKKVEWEPSMVIKALNAMDEETAKHYCKVTYTIPEAKFNAAPPIIKAMLSEARTVHLQGVSVDIEGGDDA